MRVGDVSSSSSWHELVVRGGSARDDTLQSGTTPSSRAPSASVDARGVLHRS